MSSSVYGVSSSVADLKRVAVRTPLIGDSSQNILDQYEAAHWQTPDLALLSEQHAAFVATLSSLGCEVVEFDAVEGLPDAVFVYDPVFVAPSGSISLTAQSQLAAVKPST